MTDYLSAHKKERSHRIGRSCTDSEHHVTVPRAGVIASMSGKSVCEENGMQTVRLKSGVFGISLRSSAIRSKLDYSELGASQRNGQTYSVVCFLSEREVVP